MDALEKQLAEEAELASATLDRAEAAERELASLRAQLEERQARRWPALLAGSRSAAEQRTT